MWSTWHIATKGNWRSVERNQYSNQPVFHVHQTIINKYTLKKYTVFWDVTQQNLIGNYTARDPDTLQNILLFTATAKNLKSKIHKWHVASRISIKVTLYTGHVAHLLDHTVMQMFVNTNHTCERKTKNALLEHYIHMTLTLLCYHHTLDFSLRMNNTCPSAILYQFIIYFLLKCINWKLRSTTFKNTLTIYVWKRSYTTAIIKIPHVFVRNPWRWYR